ncbi:MAG: hypothetical protein WD135_06880 [Ferruginibacter sp.]
MSCTSNFFFLIRFVAVFLIFNVTASAQQKQKIKVIDASTQQSISNVTVKISKKAFYAITNNTGSTTIPTLNISNTDSIEFTCVGFKTLKTSFGNILQNPTVQMQEDTKELENITVKNYQNTSEIGSRDSVSGYFKGWYAKKNSGEIGRIMYVKSEDFKLEKVRFKINNQCDTCVLRLHVRRLKNGLPEDELLKDSISIVSNRLSFDDKYIEFDLNPYNVIIQKNKYIFVSLETLYCNNIDRSSCSLALIGTEEGNFLYRTRDYREWEEDYSNSLYLKIYFKF